MPVLSLNAQALAGTKRDKIYKKINWEDFEGTRLVVIAKAGRGPQKGKLYVLSRTTDGQYVATSGV